MTIHINILYNEGRVENSTETIRKTQSGYDFHNSHN